LEILVDGCMSMRLLRAKSSEEGETKLRVPKTSDE
jgi:hypothetical protein